MAINVMEELNFQALLIDGSNHHPWSMGVETHLAAKDLHHTIIMDQGQTLHEKAKALILMHRHLVEPLKRQHMNKFNPRILWDALVLRFDHTHTIFLVQPSLI